MTEPELPQGERDYPAIGCMFVLLAVALVIAAPAIVKIIGAF